MTLIAATTNFQNPILFSDILFTTNGETPDVTLPTVPASTEEFLDDTVEYRPIFLKQKMYIPHQDLCVLLAGDYDEMRGYLKKVREFCNNFKGKRLTKADVQKFTIDHDPNKLLSGSAVFLCYIERFNDEDGYCHQIKFGPWGIRQSEMFENIYACASGKESCLRLATQPTNHYSNTNDEQTRAIQTNMNFISILLTREWVNQSSVKDGWGAGYEIAHYNGREFKKLDNLCYVLWRGDFDNSIGEVGTPVPRMILHYKYFGNNLRLTSIVTKKVQLTNQAGTLLFDVLDYDVTTYLIPEIDEAEKAPVDLTDLSFKTHLISQGFALAAPNDMIKTPGFFTHSLDVSVELRISKYLRIVLPNELLNDVKKIVDESEKKKAPE